MHSSLAPKRHFLNLLQTTTAARIHSFPRMIDAFLSQDHCLTAAFSYVSILVSMTLSGIVIQASWRAMNSLQIGLL